MCENAESSRNWNAGCGESHLSGVGSTGRNSTVARQHGRRPLTPYRILYGTVTGPTFHAPVRAMVLYLANGTRVWKSVTALRWVPLPQAAVFTPDAIQPQDA